MNLLSRVKSHPLPADPAPGDGYASGKDVLRAALRSGDVFRPAGFDDPAADLATASRQDRLTSRVLPTLSASRVAASEEAQTRYADLLFNVHRLGGAGR
jgi:hypothetical protein